MEADLEVNYQPNRCGNWLKLQIDNIDAQPSPRVGHTVIYHKNTIFIYGGWTHQASSEQYRYIYKFNIVNRQWQKQLTNFPSGYTLMPLQNHSCALYHKIMFLIGGRNIINGCYHTDLWGLNLQSLNWKKQQQKGIIPDPRECCAMHIINKNYLIMMGGTHRGRILNDINFYNIETRYWQRIESKYHDHEMPARCHAAICAFGNYIFVFGGHREVNDGVKVNHENLDDFYQVGMVLEVDKSNGEIDPWQDANPIQTNSDDNNSTRTIIRCANPLQ